MIQNLQSKTTKVLQKNKTLFIILSRGRGRKVFLGKTQNSKSQKDR